MVDRTEATFEQFEGEVVDVDLEPAQSEERTPQWHIQIKPLKKEIGGKTGKMHTWVRETATTTEHSIPRGSVIDRYLEALTDIHGDVFKNLKTVKESFEFMKGKKYLFKSKVLGRAFKDSPPAEYWVPVKAL
jgi:hypothetical protein